MNLLNFPKFSDRPKRASVSAYCLVIGVLAISFWPVRGFAQYRFEEATFKTGLKASSSQPAEIGPGPVVFDFDNDGWDDIYTAGGTSRDHLFRNMHDGTFLDISDTNFQQKFHTNSYTRGGTAFDFDGDGLEDLYIACERHDILLKNMGGGVFTDVSKSAHIATPLSLNETNTATFGDFDGDGDNDLFVPRWVEEYRFDQPSGGAPTGYAHKGYRDYFYVNNGNSTFTESGVAFHVDGDTACGNIGLFFDYDRDGDLDLLVGNDFGVALLPNAVFKNMLMETGTATFVEVSDSIGMRTHLFCMGIAPNDFNRDGKFDFFETNIGNEPMMQNMGDHFEDVSAQIHTPTGRNRGNPDYMTVSWTPLFFDFDNDGWEDAFIVHGFEKALAPWLTVDPDTSEFIRNLGGYFEDYTDIAMNGLLMDLRARGGAMIDYDKDGYPDLLYAGENQVAGFPSRDYRIFHNITPSIQSAPAHMLEMKFRAMRTAHEGIGTIVDVWAGGIIHSRQVSTGGGFSSMNTLTQHVGLGSLDRADSIIVYWPADKNRHRQIDRYTDVAADQLITFQEKIDESSPGIIASEPLKPLVSVRATAPSNETVQVFPLPASNSLTISGLPISGDSHYMVVNMLGQKVLSGIGHGSEIRLAVDMLSAGTYEIAISDAKTLVHKTFIKE